MFCPVVYGTLGRAAGLLRTLEPFARSGVPFDKPQREPESLDRISRATRHASWLEASQLACLRAIARMG
ncbi:MAG: hypothetical protein AUK47_20015 [Deltaproteobacteria bacterium CG2_30_63_29]|nr:MAG: hypothetical protein AUK47_20015 [Deltaproteobacteria bacterium CG2_30_63_29]PJB34029.1 MAG: hypothetical protein CO108_29385 [Deltaproteobacteria bacterium CG_4_9_14_3_um_filter_63_12]